MAAAACSLIVWIWDPIKLVWKRFLLGILTKFFDSQVHSFLAETIALRMATDMILAILSPDLDWPEEWNVQTTG